MIIDGKGLADSILEKLSETVATLKKGGITPTMAVILVGDDSGSLSYIKQKQKAASRIGAKVIFEQLPATIQPETLRSAIAHYNNDSSIHGLIVQRPIPNTADVIEEILNSVAPAKDVDGFIPNSPFEVPIARAVITLLEDVHAKLSSAGLVRTEFKKWLNSQSVAVIGRGQTAGKPIAHDLITYGCMPSIIHSKTSHPEKILRAATVVISCAGKEHVIHKHNISSGVILISVGLSRGKDGKLHGDYAEKEIESIASFYTPTPGGVGPVNVACLMHNLVDATLLTIPKSR